jgi:hypothetical protein
MLFEQLIMITRESKAVNRTGGFGCLGSWPWWTICLLTGLILLGCQTSPSMLMSLSGGDGFTAQRLTRAEALSGYEQVLVEYVEPDGIVDFQRWSQNSISIEKLDSFLVWNGAADKQNYPEIFNDPLIQRAFYINAYNACVLRGILEHYPLERLRDCPVDFFTGLHFQVAGQRLSLNELAQRCGIEQDGRVAFALGLPLRSGPVISREVYQADTLEAQLNQAIREYLGSCSGFQIDYEKQRVLFGRLIMEHQAFFLDYYQNKFGVEDISLISALVPWAGTHNQEQLVDLVGQD